MAGTVPTALGAVVVQVVLRALVPVLTDAGDGLQIPRTTFLGLDPSPFSEAVRPEDEATVATNLTGPFAEPVRVAGTVEGGAQAVPCQRLEGSGVRRTTTGEGHPHPGLSRLILGRSP